VCDMEYELATPPLLISPHRVDQSVQASESLSEAACMVEEITVTSEETKLDNEFKFAKIFAIEHKENTYNHNVFSRN